MQARTATAALASEKQALLAVPTVQQALGVHLRVAVAGRVLLLARRPGRGVLPGREEVHGRAHRQAGARESVNCSADDRGEEHHEGEEQLRRRRLPALVRPGHEGLGPRAGEVRGRVPGPPDHGTLLQDACHLRARPREDQPEEKGDHDGELESSPGQKGVESCR